MMKHTLEKKNNNNQCIVLITSTFDLYMNKGAFDTFALVFNFLTLDWEPKHVTLGLFEAKDITIINLAK